MEFMLLFIEAKGAPSGGPQDLAAMGVFSNDLARQGKLRRGAPLLDDFDGARIRVRDGEVLVTDGPFAESKESVGGYGVVHAANRAEAIEIGRHYPHAKWGTVEVREIRFFDPTSV